MTGIYGVALHPDGSMTTMSTPETVRSKADMFAGMDVFSCPNPGYVGVVGEWSTVNQEPYNHLAWCCYGRGPLHGPAIITRDDRGPLDPVFVSMLTAASDLVKHGFLDAATIAAAAYWRH